MQKCYVVDRMGKEWVLYVNGVATLYFKQKRIAMRVARDAAMMLALQSQTTGEEGSGPKESGL